MKLRTKAFIHIEGCDGVIQSNSLIFCGADVKVPPLVSPQSLLCCCKTIDRFTLQIQFLFVEFFSFVLFLFLMIFCTVPDKGRIIIADLFLYDLRQQDYSLITVVSLAVYFRLIVDRRFPLMRKLCHDFGAFCQFWQEFIFRSLETFCDIKEVRRFSQGMSKEKYFQVSVRAVRVSFIDQLPTFLIIH